MIARALPLPFVVKSTFFLFFGLVGILLLYCIEGTVENGQNYGRAVEYKGKSEKKKGGGGGKLWVKRPHPMHKSAMALIKFDFKASPSGGWPAIHMMRWHHCRAQSPWEKKKKEKRA